MDKGKKGWRGGEEEGNDLYSGKIEVTFKTMA